MLLGCSSYFKRKECEKTNWYQHAHEVAMSGRRLDQDPRIQECRKVDTEINDGEMDRGFKLGMHNYCKVESSLSAGSEGKTFNYDFCDSNIIPALKRNHQKGIQSFCRPDNAYLFASQGGVYENQCHHLNESAYMVRFRQGRKIFLTTRRDSLYNEQRQIANDLTVRGQRISLLDENIKRLDLQILSAERTYAKRRERESLQQPQNTSDGFSSSSLTNIESSYNQRMERLEYDRSELLRQRDQASRDIQALNDRQLNVQMELQEVHAELSALRSI